MHLKKTKKTPRTIRIIALMLSLVLMFFTMTGMALAEEGTDVPDAAPDSTLEIVEAELELEPGPTEEPPAETPGAEETPEPTPEPEEPSIPPEPTDTPVLEPDYELDAEIPTGWHNAPVTITVRLIDKNNTGWVKIEVAFSDEDDAERFDVTEEWNEYGYWERTMLDNSTVYFFVTDPLGVEHELFLDVYCMDFEAPTLRAGINGTLSRFEMESLMLLFSSYIKYLIRAGQEEDKTFSTLREMLDSSDPYTTMEEADTVEEMIRSTIQHMPIKPDYYGEYLTYKATCENRPKVLESAKRILVAIDVNFDVFGMHKEEKKETTDHAERV